MQAISYFTCNRAWSTSNYKCTLQNPIRYCASGGRRGLKRSGVKLQFLNWH